MRAGTCGLVVAAICVVAGHPLASQNAAAPQQLELVTPQGTRTAVLRMPPGGGRVPVVLIASGGNLELRSDLAEALGSHRVASVRVDVAMDDAAVAGSTDVGAREIAAWITRLRNDARFDRVMAAGVGRARGLTSQAARAARADGYIALALDGGEMPSVAAGVREFAGPTIPIRVETESVPAALEATIQFIRQTPVPRHPETERRSLRDVVMTDIAGSRISVEYGRPSKRGRVIWGSLVPWGRWWMPGADEATTFTTSKPLEFGTLKVPAGDYTIYTEPGDASFMLIINQATGVFHTTYQSTRDLGRVEMQKVTAQAPAEQLTFAVEPQGSGGVLKLTWDDREYSAAFTVGR